MGIPNLKQNATVLDKEKGKCWALIVSTFFITSTFIVIHNFGSNESPSYGGLTRGLTEAYTFSPGSESIPQQQQKILEKVASTSRKLHYPRPQNWHNMLVSASETYTSTVVNQLRLANSTNTSDCMSARTFTAQLNDLPGMVDGMPTFQADQSYQLTLDAFEENGKRRCNGGDYYEVDLHQKDPSKYRSRPPTVDFLNGSYGLEFIIPSQFSGEFVLEIWLLFPNWRGIFWSEAEQAIPYKLMYSQELRVVVGGENGITDGQSKSLFRPNSSPKQITKCSLKDFDRTTWQGRWSRTWFNEACEPDGEKRFRCLPEEHYRCEAPWCDGPVGRMESNGWVYSAHCSFKIFERDEAWQCLAGKWIFAWGDSNFQDTLRNLLIFILGWDVPIGQSGIQTIANYQVDRIFDYGFVNPAQKDQMLQMSLLFNGANDVTWGGEGVYTLTYKEHQDKVLSAFNSSQKRLPDIVLMNSGLHDGQHFKGVEDFSEALDFAIQWWVQLYERLPANRRPILIWRSTIATAGPTRTMKSNPQKMEIYNLVAAEKLQRARDEHKLPVKFIDMFDMTFPFHYDLSLSDGGHYGRSPGVENGPWPGNVHWYFVDLMLCHMILNIICSDQV